MIAGAADDLADAADSIDDKLQSSQKTETVGSSPGSHRRGISPNVEEYWNEYYEAVGRQGDDLQSLSDSARRKGLSVIEGSETAFNTRTGNIELAPDAKRWEFFEEFLHKKVAGGWKKDEIAALSKKLKKVKDFKGKKSVGAPGTSAEEIIVKQWLLNHGSLVGIGEPERKLLNSQINQLKNYGTKRGY